MNEQEAWFTGKWEGYFQYGDQYPEERRRIKVGFQIRMTVEEGRLQGTCEEFVTRAYMREPAAITGRIEGNTIEFVKQYPFKYHEFDDRDIRVYKSKPSLPVFYTGSFEPANGTFYGEWRIEVLPGEDEVEREGEAEGLPGGEPGETGAGGVAEGGVEGHAEAAGAEEKGMEEKERAAAGAGDPGAGRLVYTGRWEMRKI